MTRELFSILASEWHLPPDAFFVSIPNADAVGMLLTLVNWSAKTRSEWWYEIKNWALQELAATAPAWLRVDGNVIYIEGSTRQFSFHYWDKDISQAWTAATHLMPMHHGWDRTENQPIILSIIWDEYRMWMWEEQ